MPSSGLHRINETRQSAYNPRSRKIEPMMSRNKFRDDTAVRIHRQVTASAVVLSTCKEGKEKAGAPDKYRGDLNRPQSTYRDGGTS